MRASAITCHSIKCEMKQSAFYFFHSQTFWGVRHCQGFSRLVILIRGGNRASCLRIAELCCKTTNHSCSLHFHCFSLVCGDLQHATLNSGFQWLYACNGAGPFHCTFQFQLLWFPFSSWTLYEAALVRRLIFIGAGNSTVQKEYSTTKSYLFKRSKKSHNIFVQFRL